jgi:hypothetical protein
MSSFEKSGGAPRADLPFPDHVIDYCTKRLIALGLKPDRAWMKAEKFTVVELISMSEQAAMASEAWQKVPKSGAIWETSDFYRWAIPLAIYDVLNGPMDRFEHFELLYLRILGEQARTWLPSLYLAAISSPAILPEYRIEFFNQFVPDRLDVEQEIADREARLGEE